MMIARIYGMLWLAGAAVGAALYLTNSLDATASIILGFFISVLAGAGLLVVYPALMAERVAVPTVKVRGR